jgi:plasmid stability protein
MCRVEIFSSIWYHYFQPQYQMVDLMIWRPMTSRRPRRGAMKARRHPKSEQFVKWTLRLPEPLDAALKSRAGRQGRSANWMAIMLLQEALACELGQLENKRPQLLATDGGDEDEQPPEEI